MFPFICAGIYASIDHYLSFGLVPLDYMNIFFSSCQPNLQYIFNSKFDGAAVGVITTATSAICLLLLAALFIFQSDSSLRRENSTFR